MDAEWMWMPITFRERAGDWTGMKYIIKSKLVNEMRENEKKRVTEWKRISKTGDI